MTGNALFIGGAFVAMLSIIGLPERFCDWSRWSMWRAMIGIAACAVSLLGLLLSACRGAG